MSLPEATERFRDGLMGWSEDHQRSFPWREPDASLYEVFMSEMFLRRTRSDVVESFIPEFLERYPDIPSLRAADQEELAEVIRPMGLQNKRARGLIELAHELEDDTIPTELDELLALPQVGPYVANATLCFALDDQRPIIDRNVDRIYRRLLGDEWGELDQAEQWAFAEAMLPDGAARRFNLALLDFAAAVCAAPDPNCGDCFASKYCEFYQGVVQEE
jgi:A/G-specific adenine glycosylase